jgi:mannose-6-phosphate isomerase-like protein (cupin superfamily)
MRHAKLDELELRNGRGPVFAALEFATPWSLFDCVQLLPGGVHHADCDRPCEQGYVVLEGAVELQAEGIRERLEGGPGVILGPTGRTHILVNPGQERLRLLHVRVEMESPSGDLPARVARVDPGMLSWRDAIHGGTGRMATRHIWNPGDFASAWTFMDHAVLGPDSSVGYHYHDALEECFVVLKGQGRMTIADRTFAVGPRAATWQGIREAHGLYNPGPDDLEFVRIAVACPGDAYTTIDLHDDLSGRHFP